MLSRIFYAIRQGWRYRTQLNKYCMDSNLQLSNVFALSAPILQQKHVKAMVLDYDGVLAAHGEITPRPEVVSWLQDAEIKLGIDKIYILSNKPKPERLSYFKRNFPQIEFVLAPRKKPYPDGLQQIISDSGLAPAQLIILDDRLGTGILAAIIAGVQAIFITDPYINLRGQTSKELGTQLLRWLEKVVYTG